MTVRLLLVAALLVLVGDDGDGDGRRGNALYERGQYAEAEAAYRAGLQAQSDSLSGTYAALQNNLGAALFRQEKYQAARRAFDRSQAASRTDANQVRALYNAGNAAAAMGALEDALGYYREALLTAPNDERARFNYEFLKREMAKRQQQRGRPPRDIEPSPYAERLKRRAEAMVARRQYDAAHALMNEGLQQDSTVAAFADFITRLRDVAQINRSGS